MFNPTRAGTRPLTLLSADCDVEIGGVRMTCAFHRATLSGAGDGVCFATIDGFSTRFRQETETRWVSEPESTRCDEVLTLFRSNYVIADHWFMTQHRAARPGISDDAMCPPFDETFTWERGAALPCTTVQTSE